MKSMGFKKIFINSIFTIVSFIVIWYLLGIFLIFPIDITPYYSYDQSSQDYDVYVNIINVGLSNMNDVIFNIKTDCNTFFSDPIVFDNDEIKNCKINTDYRKLDMLCERFKKEDTVLVKAKTKNEPINCSMIITYQPTAFPQNLIPIPFYISTRIMKIPSSYGDRGTEYEPIHPDFKGIRISDMQSIRTSFYSNSNVIVTFDIISSENYSFSLVEEWFKSDQYIGKWNTTSEIKENWKWKWYGWSILNTNKDSEEFSFRVVLTYDNKQLENKTSFFVEKKDELKPYVKKTDIISWNNDIVSWTLNQFKDIENLNDEEQSRILLNITRNTLINPIETEKRKYYEDYNISSIETFNKKIGSSSEFSVFYAMLNRVLGIPAKVKMISIPENPDFYYVEVYLKNRGWIIINPIDILTNFGECEKCVDGIELNW
jgi:hypothetical protein